MTPAEAIEMLDRQLSEHGEPVKLQRREEGALAQEVDLLAFVRGFEPQELVNGISQENSKVILSPTGLAGWPAGQPAEGERLVIGGHPRMIIAAHAIRIGSTIVRLECAVS